MDGNKINSKTPLLLLILLATFFSCKNKSDSAKNLKYDYSVSVIKETIIEPLSRYTISGADLVWNKGTSPIAQCGDTIYVVIPEQDFNKKPLCDRKWVLYRKLFTKNNWERISEGETYGEREPFPLGILNSHPVISTNPAGPNIRREHSNGTNSCYTKPALIEIVHGEKNIMMPEWDKNYGFFEHSYRGFSVDNKNKRIFITQQAPLGNEEYGQAWVVLDQKGKTLKNGVFRFPQRGCYPVLSINGKKAFAVFDSDIVEPNKEFRKFKKEITHNSWDYVFQNLYFSYTNDVFNTDFSQIITLDSCVNTSGYIRALDLWNLPNGDVFVLYYRISTHWPFIRDKYFPDKPIEVALKSAQIRDGKIIERKTLIKAVDNLKPWTEYKLSSNKSGVHINLPHIRTSTPKPTWGRYYSPDGKHLFLIWYQHDFTRNESGNFIKEIYPKEGKSIHISLQQDLRFFSLPSQRNGSDESNKLALYGSRAGNDNLSYCVEMEIKQP